LRDVRGLYPAVMLVADFLPAGDQDGRAHQNGHQQQSPERQPLRRHGRDVRVTPRRPDAEPRSDDLTKARAESGAVTHERILYASGIYAPGQVKRALPSVPAVPGRYRARPPAG